MPTLESIQVGLPRNMGRRGADDPHDKPWTSAIFKTPIDRPVLVGPLGLDGDGQADLENHGGEDKAVLFYSAAHYADWAPILGPGSEVFGAFGENLSVSGLTEETVCIGDTWQIGDEVQLQISQPRQPCWKLARKWRLRDLVLQVQQTGRTGWYARVVKMGTIAAGQSLTLLERPQPDWTVARANDVLYHRKDDVELALELAALPELSESWRGMLDYRAARLNGA